MTENEACLCFSLSNGVGPKTFLKLVKHFGSVAAALQNLDSNNRKEIVGDAAYKKFDASRAELDLNSYLEMLKKAKVKVVGYTDQNYTSSLKELDAPPIVIYCKGNLKLLDSNNSIAVVGARKITSYGRDVTEKLVAELVNYGFTIVSGLAFGVDGVAHKTALDNHGSTIAVLGCGVDVPYPSENQDLYEKILDNGGLIVSEYPLGMEPGLGTFPARNRIIAGLSLGVLVTEAAEDSGSLITAEEAIKLGRPVFAVPGSIQSQMSRGTLKLLKQGATLVSSGEDILQELRITNHELRVGENLDKIKNLKLDAKERMIVELVESEALSLDQLSKLTKIPTVKLMVLVSSLEMRGILENKGGEIRLRENNP